MVCDDVSSVPLLDAFAPVRLIVTEGSMRLQRKPDGTRFLLRNRSRQFERPERPWVVVAKGPKCSLNRSMALFPSSPDAALMSDLCAVPDNFRTVHAALPWFGLHQDTESISYDRLKSRLEALDSGLEDALDTLQSMSGQTFPISGLGFSKEGGAVLNFDPLTRVRDTDEGVIRRLVFLGALYLERFVPVTLRLPTLSIREPRFTLTVRPLGDRSEPLSVSSIGTAIDRCNLKSGTSESLTIDVAAPGDGFVDLEVSGHGLEVVNVGLYLDPLSPFPDIRDADPLNQYEDPLAGFSRRQT